MSRILTLLLILFSFLITPSLLAKSEQVVLISQIASKDISNFNKERILSAISEEVAKNFNFKSFAPNYDFSKIYGKTNNYTPPDSAAEIEKLIASAKNDYDNLNFSQASESLTKAELLFEKDIIFFEANELYLRVKFLLALTYSALHMKPQKEKAIKELLLFNPEYYFDSNDAPPKTLDELKKLKDNILSSNTGKIKIVVSTPETDVFLNARHIAKIKSEFTLNKMPFGNYQIKAKKDGYFSYVTKTEHKKSETIINISLTKIDENKLLVPQKEIKLSADELAILKSFAETEGGNILLLNKLSKTEKEFKLQIQLISLINSSYSDIKVVKFNDLKSPKESLTKDLTDFLATLNENGSLTGKNLTEQNK